MFDMLICDDEPYILEMLTKNIDWSQCGVRVAGTAVNGQQGLNQFQLGRFDLVLADIKMPVMSGVEMARRIREQDSRVQIIFLTSLGEFEYAQRAVNIGACGYILKPFRNEELIAAVRNAVDRLSSEPQARAAEREPLPPQTDFIVENVNRYIEENIGHKLSLKAIAEHFGYSPNYLGQLYKKHTGLYVNDQIIKMRMERAATLLRVPQNQIGSIADLLGYSDYGYFIKQFKEYYGETPKAFRDGCFRTKGTPKKE